MFSFGNTGFRESPVWNINFTNSPDDANSNRPDRFFVNSGLVVFVQ